MKHHSCIWCIMLSPLLSSCEKGSQEKSLQSPPAAVQQNEPKREPDATTNSDSDQKVKLYFHRLDLDDLAVGLTAMSGRQWNVHPGFKEMRPTYRFTLISEEIVSMGEVIPRVIAKLRSDGLEVLENENSLEIKPGNYRDVWKPGT